MAIWKILKKLDDTRYDLQIDFVGNEPVQAYSRYGVGSAGSAVPSTRSARED
ncbi:type VI secretion system contractile sheath protein TssC [Deinococcus sp. Arct2-2]|uniref:type VI secretion system contractile sheath protein TssC n=1 Tax=Deinococcus sp. Arct2-2 TaxID=2568653 RepID=UPI001454CE09|nr:type VI secretion system contractile sheath protein TssC [Deinococcus sp. Arct2-2]